MTKAEHAAKYKKSPKGKAASAKYKRSATGIAARKRYKRGIAGRKAAAKYRAVHHEDILRNQHAKREQNRQEYLAYGKKYYEENVKPFPDKMRLGTVRSRKRNYGVTDDQYKTILASQNSVCAICSGVNADGRELAVDHNHKTQMVRGLLCSTCNSALAYLQDSPELVRRAFNYLVKYAEAA